MDDPTEKRRQAEYEPHESRENSRLQLLLDVFVFQFKLAADGLRDILLSPLSIISAIMGLLSGGDDPYRYFRQLLQLGRRSESWINLFGHRKRAGTADDLIAPIKSKVMSEAENNPWISKAGGQLNRKLDNVSERMKSATSASKPNAEREDRD